MGETLVLPGERLGVIEEFVPGRGTYVEDGNIYSAVTGQLQVDRAKREIHVKSLTHQPLLPKVGDVVIGKVTNVSEKTMMMRIVQIGDKWLSTSFTGMMHISDSSPSYVKTMDDAFKVGDVVRAKVISTKNREFHLSTQSDNLGVIVAACTRCGAPLTFSRGRLRCGVCNYFDRRKLASDYSEGDAVFIRSKELDLA